MREILFRGKRKDNCKWVEGYLHKRDGLGTGYTEFAIQVQESSESRPWSYTVIPETVGQYTGLTDKNGKRIFEGDIVISKHPRRLSNKPFIVTYKPIVGGYGYWKLDIHDQLEVIGNIHDNPELIAEVEG